MLKKELSDSVQPCQTFPIDKNIYLIYKMATNMR